MNNTTLKQFTLIFLLLAATFMGCKKEDPAPEPVAAFTFMGDNTPAPATVSFSNTSKYADSYNWEFGDGGVSTDKSPKHTYTTAGEFKVKLTAAGEGGEKTTTKTVIIKDAIPEPTANFTYSGADNFAPCRVEFSNTSSNATDYEWDFGDGNSSDKENPTNVFNSGGTYNVTLTAINSEGKQNVINKTITIKNKPTEFVILGLQLTDFPTTDSNGASWDDTTGPDLYFELTDDSGNEFFTTGYYEDVLTSDLPLSYTNNFPYIITNLNKEYKINLRDYDSWGTDDNLGWYYFTVSDQMPTNGDTYPTILNFVYTSGWPAFTMYIEWKQ